MKKVGRTAVTNAKIRDKTSGRSTRCIRKLKPDYILILGSIDVIPHQDLKNPVRKMATLHARRDIPFACEKAYSRKPEDFVGPTRFVGSLPDLSGGIRSCLSDRPPENVQRISRHDRSRTTTDTSRSCARSGKARRD
jgi:hypothetical protein